MYEIAEYDKRYMPRDKSRHPLAHADYVKLPVKPKGDGLKTLLKHKRGLEVFAIWCLLLEKTTLEKPENRGKLLNHREQPASTEEIAMSISLEKKVKLIEYALSLLTAIGWINCAEGAGKCGESAPLSVVKCSEVKSSVVKGKYMDFVFLSEVEYKKLVEKFGEKQTKKKIGDLNHYIGSKGKKYTSHYHTILSWDRSDAKDNQQPAEKPKTCVVCQGPGRKFQVNDKEQKIWLCEVCVMCFQATGWTAWGKLPLAVIERKVHEGKAKLKH